MILFYKIDAHGNNLFTLNLFQWLIYIKCRHIRSISLDLNYFIVYKGPFQELILSLIPVWISNHTHYKMCKVITHPSSHTLPNM